MQYLKLVFTLIFRPFLFLIRLFDIFLQKIYVMIQQLFLLVNLNITFWWIDLSLTACKFLINHKWKIETARSGLMIIFQFQNGTSITYVWSTHVKPTKLQNLRSTYDGYLDQSPAILTSDNFIRSNEIIRTKWPIYVVIGHFVLIMS